MIRSKRGLIVTGIVVFLLGLIVLLPARIAYRWFAPPEVLASGLTGTVWRGGARETSFDGLYLRGVKWRAKPWRLVTGRLTFHVTGNPPSGSIETDVSAILGGTIALGSLRASFPIHLDSGFRGMIGLEGLSCDANLQFERMDFADGLLVAADGSLQVSDLRVPLVGDQSLGRYKMEFFTQNNGVVASIEDEDGAVDLAGSLQISNDDRSFEFVGQVAAKPETPAVIRQRLKFLGAPNERGQYELRLEGTL